MPVTKFYRVKAPITTCDKQKNWRRVRIFPILGRIELNVVRLSMVSSTSSRIL